MPRLAIKLLFLVLTWSTIATTSRLANAIGAKTAQDALREAVRIAENTQLDWIKAKTELETARLEATLTRSAYLPNLELSSELNYNWQTANRGVESLGSFAGLRSTWNIFDNGHSWRSHQQQLLKVDQAQLKNRQVRDRVSLEILSKLSQAWLAKRRREITEQRLVLLNSQFKLTEQQFRQGLKARRDYLRLKAETQRAQINLDRQINQSESYLEQLQSYLGQDHPLSWAELGAFTGNRWLQHFDSLLERTKSRGSIASQIQRLETEQAEIQIEQSRRQLWPELNLSVSGGYGSDSFAGRNEAWQDRNRWSSMASISATWMLWDWGGRKGQAERDILNMKVATQTFSQSEIDFKTQLSHLLRERQRLARSVQLVKEVYEIELQTFKDIEAEYREGRTGYLDLISSLDRRSSAELELEEELHQSLLNKAETLTLTGDLYDAIMDY